MTGTALIFFFVFGVIITLMYMALRRQWFNPTLTVAVSMLASTAAMILSLINNNDEMMNLQAIFFGFLISLVFNGVAMAMAWYFQSNEFREQGVYHDAPEPMLDDIGDVADVAGD